MTSEAKAERLAAQIASGIGKTLLFILTLAILAGIGLAVRELGGLDYAKTLIDYQRIAGRYERPIGPGSMEFRTDGTVLEQAPLATNKGTYKLLPEQRIEIEMEGLLWGTNTAVFRWELIDNQLCLGLDGGTSFAFKLKLVE